VKETVNNLILMRRTEMTNSKFSDLQSFLNSFREILAISIVNYAGTESLTNVLSKYNDILKLELSGDYVKLDPIEVNKALYHKEFKSISEISSAFENRVKVLIDDKNKKVQTSSGGGSSSGSSSPSYTIKPIERVEPYDITQKLQENAKVFEDIEGHWAKDYILKLEKAGIVDGDGSENFYPEQKVKKEEFIKMIVLALNVLDNNAKVQFNDVGQQMWYSKYIASAQEINLIYGDEKNNFGLGTVLTREDMCVIVYRGMLNKKITDETITRDSLQYQDASEISQYAKEAVSFLTKAEIIQGTGDQKFIPKDICTRAQAATIISKLLELEER